MKMKYMGRVKSGASWVMCIVTGLLAGFLAASMNALLFATGSGQGSWIMPYVGFLGALGFSVLVFAALHELAASRRRVLGYLLVCFLSGLLLWLLINYKLEVGFVHP
jgi:hypothetical protein